MLSSQMSWRRLSLDMAKKKIINPRPRGRPPKEIPRLDATPQQVARAIFSGVKPPDPSIRVRKTQARKPKVTR